MNTVEFQHIRKNTELATSITADAIYKEVKT